MIGEEVHAAVEEGRYGAVVCDYSNQPFGCFIVGWKVAPWTDQERDEFMC